MLARRGFLYKRQSGGHPAIASQLSSPAPLAKPDTVSPSTPAATTSDAITPLTPVLPTQTTSTPATPSASSAASLSTPTTSSTSSSSSSPSSASSSVSTSSSASHATPSTPSTPLTPSTPVHAPSVSTQVVPGVSSTHSTALSATATSTTGSSGGTNTSAIVGGIAGTLAGIAILGFLLMWCMRRQRSRDADDFDAQAFKRQSAMLVDEPAEPSRSYNPRPPTMIERHNTSHALTAQAGYSGQNFYGSYGGYSQQPPYAPPEMIQSAGSPPPQTYGAQPMGYAGYNDYQQQIARQPSHMGHGAYSAQQQQLARQPSNAEYLTRQPTSAAGYAPPPAPPGSLDPHTQYIDLNRSSISPYQAAQYADISRQLGTTDSNSQTPPDLPEGPLPSPFDDPAQTTLVPNTSPHAHLDHTTDVAATGSVPAAPAPHTQEERPMTVYGESDPYGGI